MIFMALQVLTPEVTNSNKVEFNNLDLVLSQIIPNSGETGNSTNPNVLLDWLKNSLTLEVEIQKELQKIQKEQAKIIDSLKHNRSQMEKDLARPEVEILRSLLEDPVLDNSLKIYQEQATKVLGKLINDQADERNRTQGLRNFIMESEQRNLNDTGRLGEMRAVKLPSSNKNSLINKFDTSYRPIWSELRKALLAHEAKVNFAKASALKNVPGNTTEATSRKLMVKRLQLVSMIISIHQRIVFEMFMP